MKRILVSIIFVICSIVNAQWFWQNPLPQGNSLIDVEFISSTVGWAVGYCGTIIKTTSGGSTWIVQSSGTQNILYSVCFNDLNNGIVVGDYGTILKTSDGGTSWIKQKIDTTINLRGVSFTDSNNGVATGNKNYSAIILKTTNGGTTWTNQTSPTGWELQGVCFIDSNIGIAVGNYGTIIRTTDGGETWVKQTSGTTNDLNRIYFIDINNAVIVGENGTILKTNNSGATWSKQLVSTTSDFYGVNFTDDNHGTIVGGDYSEGILLTTSDGGTTWIQPQKYLGWLLNVSYTDTNHGVAVGAFGTIQKTTDGGSTWTEVSSGRTIDLYRISYSDEYNGSAVGGMGTLLRTTNGGVTWTEQTSAANEQLYGVCFTDENNGTVVGSSGTVLRTTNGGAVWSKTEIGWRGFLGVSFTDIDNGMIVGDDGSIYKTTDKGTTWTKLISGTISQLRSVDYIDLNNCTSVGDDGTIIRTTNGGATWTKQISGTTNYLWDVCFTDSSNGTAVGDVGTILRTTDGGSTWLTQNSGTKFNLWGVSFYDTFNGLAVGEGINSTILKTTNGGATWILQPTVSSIDLHSVSYTNKYNGTAVGAYGVIIKIIQSPEMIILNSPSNGAINVPTDITFCWFTAQGISSYQLQVSTNSNFSGIVYDKSNISGLSQQVSGLLNKTKYYWRVRGINNSENDEWSSVRNFTTILALPTKPQLVFPGANQTNQPKEITLKWNKVKDAEKYLIQLSKDQIFSSITKSDSTTTDTLKAISGLDNNTKYYWRVRAKNTAGFSDWSDVWNFTTVILLPTQPQLVFPGTNQTNQPKEMTLQWNKVKDAEKYLILVSTNEQFSNIMIKDSTLADTSKTIQNLLEGQKYYWKVLAKNSVGLSPWSDIWNFITLLPPPTNLVLQRTALTEITLTWDDNSHNEYGYFIERIQNAQSSFNTIDTLMGSGNKYIDIKIEQGLTYIYRVKAYTEFAESDYSNEAGINVVSAEADGIPTEYSLSQNFPNPFNPRTCISYQIPNEGFVSLKVYDAIGNEIITLVNEEKTPGTYEVIFDGSDLPSGVYFYCIKAGEFVQTKKLVLLK